LRNSAEDSIRPFRTPAAALGAIVWLVSVLRERTCWSAARRAEIGRSGECRMKILVIHGAGMNMRGKVQVEVFGPMTLPQYDERIRNYAGELGVDVDIFHSNIEGEVINRLYDAHERDIDGAIINPAGYTTGHPALVAAIAQVKFPTIELHVSNPARRGATSDIARVTRGSIVGFGVFGYYLAMKALQDMGAGK
jgi:3-dehydroquinate dehydratase-2